MTTDQEDIEWLCKHACEGIKYEISDEDAVIFLVNRIQQIKSDLISKTRVKEAIIKMRLIEPVTDWGEGYNFALNDLEKELDSK